MINIQAGSYLGTFAEAKAAITHIFEMIDRVPSIDVFSRNFSIPTWISGDIVFDDVSFSYPTRSDHEVCLCVQIVRRREYPLCNTTIFELVVP